MPGDPALLWRPSSQRAASANLSRFMKEAEVCSSSGIADYAALWRWSIDSPAEFWRLVWNFCGVIGEGPGDLALERPDQMPGARFFPHAQLNFAENLLRRSDSSDALVFWGEDRIRRRMSWSALHAAVSQLQQALVAEGVKAGDRVAAILPNMPEAIIAMLAAASLGAIWSSCSPDFGVQGVLDRFGQIQPKVLFAVDGCFYNGKTPDALGKLPEIAARLSSLSRVVVVPYISESLRSTASPKLSLFPIILPATNRKPWSTNACRSTIPSISSFLPAPPVRPNASSTAREARSCSTSRSTSSIVISSPAIEFFTSPPAPG